MQVDRPRTHGGAFGSRRLPPAGGDGRTSDPPLAPWSAGEYEQFGGKGRYHIFRMISDVVRLVEEKTGQHWLDDRATFNEARNAILVIVDRFERPEPTRPGKSSLGQYTAGDDRSFLGIGKELAERQLSSIVGTDFPMNPSKKPE